MSMTRNGIVASGMLSVALTAGPAWAQGSARPETQEFDATTEAGKEIHFIVSGGIEYQFDTDLDSQSSFSVARYGSAFGMQMDFTTEFRGALNISYGVDLYHFEGKALGIMLPAEPWDGIHTLTATAIFSYDLNHDWTIFGGPLFQASREEGVDLDNSITAGGAIGLTYRWSRDLTIGGGVAVVSQLEDDPRISPIIVIDWALSNEWHVRNTSTGSAVNRTGLELVYSPGRGWEFAIGAARQFSRFRLDSLPPAADGVGEDESLPIWFRAGFSPSKQLTIDAIVGVNVDGTLRLENSNGGLVGTADYDPVVFVGVNVSFKF